jgi:hypothetical protein
VTDSFEGQQRLVDPHRLEEQRRAREEIEDRLRDRGIWVYPRDSDEEVGDLLEAIERFEAAVESHGGDLFVDRIGSSEPDDTAFVLPLRGLEEGATQYRLRIDTAADGLRHDRHG